MTPMDMTLALALIAAAFFLGYTVRGRSSAHGVEPPAAPDAVALETVRPVLAAEGKIAAIKAYRDKTGTGLRDAKFAVDSLDADTE